jgi:hypothetical protein
MTTISAILSRDWAEFFRSSRDFRAEKVLPSTPLEAVEVAFMHFRGLPFTTVVVEETCDFHNPVLASTPLHAVEWSTLFAYMHRRFGPPNRTTDDLKSFSGAWIISTPSPDFFLRVEPNTAGAIHSFEARVTCDYNRPYRDAAMLEEGVSAIRRALIDLMRPVEVRDQLVNSFGVVESGDPILALMADENAIDSEDGEDAAVMGRYEAVVQQSPVAHKSVPADIFGTDEWSRLLNLAYALGDGDRREGIFKIASVFELNAAERFSRATPEIRAVVVSQLLYSGIGKEAIPDLVPATATDIDLGTSVLHDVLATGGAGLREDDIAGARDILASLGFVSHIDRARMRVSRTERENREKEAFNAAVGGEMPLGDFPSEPLTSRADLDALLSSLNGNGHTGIVAWAARLLDEDGGEAVVDHVLSKVIAVNSDAKFAVAMEQLKMERAQRIA